MRNSKFGSPTPTFFWKCVKRKGFKSFVLKVCETKGVADVFLRKCVNLKSLGGILASFEVSRSFFGLLGGPSFVGPGLTSYRATRGSILAAIPSSYRRLQYKYCTTSD